MNKKEWFIVLLPLFITWSLDHFTKVWASHLSQVIYLGVINFALHHNHGAMLGFFSDLPAVLRIVSLSTGGAFLLCTYALIQYLLPIKSLTLRSGLSFLIGGIIGNVTDRILWGYVVDFIILGKPTYWLSPAFNLADALQWVGYGLIVYAVIKEGEKIWPENNIRSQYWVNLKFQLKYCFILMGVGFGLTLICSIFSYTYLRVTILELTQQNPVLMKKFLSPFIFTFMIITIAFSAILFAIGKYISHRIAGPLYAFERFLTEALEGRAKPLKLRNGDEFRHLEELANQVRTQLDKMKSNQAQIHLENSTKSNTET